MNQTATQLGQIQQRYENLAEDYEDQPNDFDDAAVEAFIEAFAKSTNLACLALESMGYFNEVADAELFRKLCCAWLINKNDVHKVVGTQFWITAKEIAQVCFNYQQEMCW